jgi:hydroxymethylpyrimidine pyrophosphatase-like HAD family hydrolase
VWRRISTLLLGALLHINAPLCPMQGHISEHTLKLYAALRATGVVLVLISGARLATLMQRLPYLPAADALVCESGGRIFFPSQDRHTAAPFKEDLVWRASHDKTAGPFSQERLQPEQRKGLLWELYASLKSQVLDDKALDAVSYTTAFRVKGEGPTARAVQEIKAHPQWGLEYAVNLGALDVYPATSGKERAARYLMQRFGAEPQECSFMCGEWAACLFWQTLFIDY